MSVSITTGAPAIAFSKNDLYIAVGSTASDYLAGTPAIAVNFLQFTTAIAAAATIQLAWELNSVTLTALADPDNTGNTFPTGDGGEAYVTSLVPYFQGSFFIDQAFTVSTNFGGANPMLVFTAKQQGAEYNFTTETNIGNTTPGVDDVPVTNFAHHIEIWIANAAGVYQQAYTSNVPLDIPLTGDSTIDIHEILHAFLSSDRPVLNAAYQQCVNSVAPYYIKYAQYFGSIPSVQRIYYSATPNPVVAKGGLGMQPSLLRDIITELCPGGADATQNRFMRQGSKNKLVTQAQPEWLTYINLSAGAQTVSLEVTIYNSDSTTVVFTPVTGLNIAQYQKFQFAAGYTQLNIAGQQASSEMVVYYCCRLKTEAGYVTDSYNFVIDYQYREWPQYFIYENSYGAFQTVATVGKGQLEYDRTKDDGQYSLDRQTAAMDGDFLECNIWIQQKGTVSIGYDRSGTRNTELLRDLLLSHSIFIYQDSALIPIGLVTKNLKDAMDGVNVYANTLEYNYLYEDEVWTEDPQPDDVLDQLITEAGSPVPNEVPPIISNSGTIIVEYNDSHLSVAGGYQVYTAPYWLAGKTNYRIACTQLGAGVPDDGEDDTAPFFRTADISYNSGAGSFTILVEDFILQEGDQLVIFPFILNPDS